MMMRAAAKRRPRNWPYRLNSLGCETGDLGARPNGTRKACVSARVMQLDANVMSMDARIKNDTNHGNNTFDGNDGNNT